MQSRVGLMYLFGELQYWYSLLAWECCWLVVYLGWLSDRKHFDTGGKMALTTEELKAKVWSDHWFAKQPTEVQEKLWQYIEKLPEVLESMLKEEGTLINIVRAKVLFATYCLKNDLALGLSWAMPSGLVFTQDEMKVAIEANQVRAIRKMTQWSVNLSRIWFKKDDFQKKSQDVLTNIGALGMTVDAYRAYPYRIPTIGELLEIQPILFVSLDPELRG